MELGAEDCGPKAKTWMSQFGRNESWHPLRRIQQRPPWMSQTWQQQISSTNEQTRRRIYEHYPWWFCPLHPQQRRPSSQIAHGLQGSWSIACNVSRRRSIPVHERCIIYIGHKLRVWRCWIRWQVTHRHASESQNAFRIDVRNTADYFWAPKNNQRCCSN